MRLAEQGIDAAAESDAEFRRRIATEAAIQLAQSGGRTSMVGYQRSRMSGAMGMPSMAGMGIQQSMTGMYPPSLQGMMRPSMTGTGMPGTVHETTYLHRVTPSNLQNILPIIPAGMLRTSESLSGIFFQV